MLLEDIGEAGSAAVIKAVGAVADKSMFIYFSMILSCLRGRDFWDRTIVDVERQRRGCVY